MTLSLGEATRIWCRIGLLSFGGPAGQIALMHKELVEERKWISEARFLHALNYCMLLPGPEAQQLAIYIGWLLHRTRGGLIAGILFVLPGFVTILALSAVYAAYEHVPIVAGLFFGLKAAVLAVVVEALIRIGKRALKSRAMIGAAACAFALLFFFGAPFPAVIATAALVGVVGARFFPAHFPKPSVSAAADDRAYIVDARLAAGELEHTKPSWLAAARTLATCGILWAAPLVAARVYLGRGHVLVEEGLFFSKAAVVTFGGAYAVLAYIAQRAVEVYGWLLPGEMLDGLGMAETTPGPLIMVVEFVGFMGAYRHPGSWPPMLAGLAGAAITVWVTFVPCFLWIFAGAPFIERLRRSHAVSAALSVVTAAVVGVIANLSVWFFVRTVFARAELWRFGAIAIHVPVWRSCNPVACIVAGGAALALLRFHVGVAKVLFASALAGAAYSVLRTAL